MKNFFLRAALLALPLLAVSCQSAESFDYGPFVEHQPTSILVLPPLDQTMEVNASYGSLSTLTKPLAEQGFYVFPAALVDSVMRSNGLPAPAEMHMVPLSKLNEIFAPDAVLYVTVKNWGTSYQVVNSSTAVTLSAKLVDARTGTKLWHGAYTQNHNTNNGGGSLLGMVASAIVNQVATSISDPSRSISSEAANVLFTYPGRGLPLGPYHPDHEQGMADLEQRLAEAQAQAAAKAE
jgi:hypothetical protein